ncbi:hypothetical protein HMPREF3188_00035 [Tissierellia bacterium KA00581]|jgi:hypothetical protein|nr:hypothetical protein HMPREF3188_00035 [Tissierellia bacterium KA00581]
MKISLKKSTIQPGVTPIENMFLDVFLPIADEISLKVYLFLYKRVFGSYEDEITLDSISKELNFSTVQIINALKYWKNNKVIDFSIDNNENIEKIEFYNFYALYSGNVYSKENNSNFDNEKPLIDNEQYFKKIENITSLSLKPYEISAIMDHMQETGHTMDLVYRAYQYADQNGKSKSTNYIIGILRAWKRDNNIMTVEDLENYLSNKDKGKIIKRSQRIKRYIEPQHVLTEKEKEEKLKDPKESSINELFER